MKDGSTVEAVGTENRRNGFHSLYAGASMSKGLGFRHSMTLWQGVILGGVYNGPAFSKRHGDRFLGMVLDYP